MTHAIKHTKVNTCLVSLSKHSKNNDYNSATLSPHDVIAREFRGSIAVAIQRRNAMTMIAGRCLAIGRAATCAAA